MGLDRLKYHTLITGVFMKGLLSIFRCHYVFWDCDTPNPCSHPAWQDISDDWERELQYNPCVLDSWKGDLQGFYMILWDISHLPKVAQAFQGFQFFVLEKVWFGTTKYRLEQHLAYLGIEHIRYIRIWFGRIGKLWGSSTLVPNFRGDSKEICFCWADGTWKKF